jgi:multimeric flavodoxin WrbA
MKIVVLNGSPKGEMSITLQYIRFLEKKYPQHSFHVLNVAHDIRKIESDELLFNEIIGTIREADGIIWAFPLYYLLVSAQYKRFIELIWERDAADTFTDTYTVAFSTSIHFFDHAAHNYIHAVCDDLGMKFLGSYSADMYDLTKDAERKRFHTFGDQFLKSIEKHSVTAREYPPLQSSPLRYEPRGKLQATFDQGNKEILILTDCSPEQTNLTRMVGTLQSCFTRAPKVVNICDIEMKGGCLGCIRCGYDNTCVYEGKDGFIGFFRETVKTSDIIIYAGAIRDRYLSSRWKMFFDRSFFNNHAPCLVGKQVGFLISGPLGQIPNLRQIFEAFVELQKGNLAGIVTDEHEQSSDINSLIEGLASRLVEYAALGYIKPVTFFGVGGRKIFRDEIFGSMRFPFQADHAYYKKHGFYDFPQKDLKTRLTGAFLTLLTKIPAMRREIYNKRMVEEMVKPVRKVVDKAA